MNEDELDWWMPVDETTCDALKALGLDRTSALFHRLLDGMYSAGKLQRVEEIRIVFQPWDGGDPYVGVEAIKRYGYPADTKGTLGWRVRFADTRNEVRS